MGRLLFCLRPDFWDQKARNRLKGVRISCRQFYRSPALCWRGAPRSTEKYLSELYCCRFPLDMANFVKFADSVIQVTVPAGILTYCPDREGRGKMIEVLRSSSIRWTTSKSFPIQVNCAFLLDNPARNTFRPHKSDRITREWPSLRDDVTQALDGFAIAGPMICKIRPLKLYSY
jgi:hypothetical protein